jgi:hypothetical protein
MSAIIQNNLRVTAAKKFVDRVGQENNFIYTFIGKSLPWDDEDSPPVPSDWIQAEIGAYDNMQYLKRVIANDVYQVIRRIDWKISSVYSPYKHNSVLFDPANEEYPFYVVTDDWNVYKCIGNAQGKPSLFKPTGKAKNIFATSDGYLWKYIYTVTSDVYKFNTNEYIPVKATGSTGSTDYGIDYIELTEKGTGYTGSTIAITITGSGTGATAYATIVSGTLDQVVITNRGSGYRSATATIAPPTTGTTATANPIVSPPGGHGHNPAYELGGHHVILVTRFVDDTDGIFSITNDFRQIGLLENPLDYLDGSALTSESLSQTTNLFFSSVVGDFEADEIVTGSISGATGRVIDWDGTEVLRLSNVVGEFHPGDEVEGAISTASGLLDIGTGSTDTAASGGTTTITLDPTAPSDITLSGYSTVIKVTAGAAINQIRIVESYEGTTKVATMTETWDPDDLPDDTSEYVIGYIKYPDIELDSGKILYMDHRRSITRSANQTEEIKVIVEF